MKSLHAICVRTWTERLRHLTMQKRYREALELGLDFYRDKGKAVVGLRGSKQRRKQIVQDKVCQVLICYMNELANASEGSCAELEIVSTCVEYCVQLETTELLFGKLWDLVSESESLKGIYLRALESPLLEGSLPPQLPPLIVQQLVSLCNQEDRLDSLQAIIILLNVDCLDIHQVTTICQQRGLWEALIHLQTAALGDYTAPIHQLVPVLQKHLVETVESNQPWDCINLGNALLVYASCCLTGRQFPRKSELPEGLPRKVKADVLRALLSQHSSLASDAERQYPYLRTLLRFDAKGFLDAIAMAFQEPEFTSEMGLRQRQRVVDILFNIVTASTPMGPENSDYLTNEQRIFVLIFIIDEIVECTVNLEANSLYKIVEILCVETGNEHKSKRENAILKLLHGNKLNSITETTLLNLTYKANFLRVSEMLHTNRGDWESVCECMMADPARHSEVLPLLQQLPTIQIDEIIKKHSRDLVNIDAPGFASIVASRLSDQIDRIIESIQDDIHCQYALLSALHNYAESEKKEQESGDKEEESESEKNSSISKLELSAKAMERFLKLMSDIEPDKVLTHLQGSYGCQPERALEIVQEANRKDAEAVLLEQSGNYQGAFDLLLGRLTEITNVYHRDKSTEEEAVKLTTQLAGLCKRSAGLLDWLPLVEVVLNLQSNNDIQKTSKALGEKLLKKILETLSGTTALSNVLEHILKQPLSTSGTIGDVRQLLTGVLAQSRYEQVLVQTTARLVSLELHEALKKSLREAGKGRTSNSLICPICRKVLSNTTDSIVIFNCNHTYHVECLSEPKVCYECIKTKGWAHPVTDFLPPSPQSTNSRTLQEQRKLEPPAFMRNKLTSLRLAPPIPWPDLEDIL